MSRTLVPSAKYAKALKKLVKKNPQFVSDISKTIKLLEENPFDSKLKTHKLQGHLNERWAAW